MTDETTRGSSFNRIIEKFGIREKKDIATGSGLMINRDMFKDLVIPRMKKLLAPAKKAGEIVTTHTDGDLNQYF